jgi:NADH:ubiquinone oxidoreductase subunit F (NADH-binding)
MITSVSRPVAPSSKQAMKFGGLSAVTACRHGFRNMLVNLMSIEEARELTMSIHSMLACEMFGLLLTTLCALTLAAPSALADSIMKSFDIAVGTAQPRSHFRTLEVPFDMTSET